MRKLFLTVCLIFLCCGVHPSNCFAEPNATAKLSPADIIHQAIKSGEIAEKLTDPDEIKAILGEPQDQKTRRDGGMELLYMSYPDIEMRFFRFRKFEGPFVLTDIKINGKYLEFGGDGILALRTKQDLKKINKFTGLQGASLKNLDLTEEYDNFKNFNFDSLTQWPEPEKLPTGFNPQKLLEDGKNPGLGIRSLHEQGINGEGVGIAIFDQSLLLGHEEYSSRLICYDSIEANWAWWGKPAMHGPPIVSIAVGKTCGVAPRAFVFYYAAGSTSGQEQIQTKWINEIIKYNETAEDSKRIRVINISASPDRDSDFRQARKRANDAGILVITCAKQFLRYGTLVLVEGKDPDNPESYIHEGYDPGDVLRVPVGNGTTASHEGIDVYTYYREGGMSWAAPYISGLAALAFQVNPNVKPETILEKLVKTATHTKAGPVVNPPGFIEAIKNLSKSSASASEIEITADKTPSWVSSGKSIKSSEVPEEDYPYLSQCLDIHSKPAQDYMLQLFDKHQIVILGEEHNVKEHKDFVIDLIPRLYHEAGVRCIGWEFSWYSQNNRLEELINAPNYDEEAVLQFARDCNPGWNSREHWEIIKAIWKLNKSLKPGSEKMRLIGLPDYVDIAKMYTIVKTKPKDSTEFQEMLKKTVEADKLMAQHVEKEILQKGHKGFLFVGMGHDWTQYQYPPEATFGISCKFMGTHLKEKYRDKVFQVRAQASSDPYVIAQVMKRRDHASIGFDMQNSPFANILVPVGKGAPDVPWSKLACGYLYLGTRASFHSNTPIKGFVNEKMFEKYKDYYEVDYGRSFNSAKEVDDYLQQYRWPMPN